MIKQAGNILLSVVLLISFGGFSINMHYCHEKLYDLAIISEAHSCCDDVNHSHVTTCHADMETQQSSHDCQKDDMEPMHCENKSVKIESTDNFIISSFNFSADSEYRLLLLTKADPFDLSFYHGNPEFVYTIYSDISPPDTGTSLALLQSYRN